MPDPYFFAFCKRLIKIKGLLAQMYLHNVKQKRQGIDSKSEPICRLTHVGSAFFHLVAIV